MHHAIFGDPDVNVFRRLDDHGLTASGLVLTSTGAVLECRVTERDPFCRGCGAEATPRGTQARRLARIPFGNRPTTLLLRVRRYRCDTCERFLHEDTQLAAPPRSKLTHGGLRWALEPLVCQHLPVTRIAKALDVS